MDEDLEIVDNYFVVYSPDEEIWYLERRIPNNWAVSKQNYPSRRKAVIAFMAGKVEWEDA